MEHILERLPQENHFIVKLLKVPTEHDLYVIVDAIKGKLHSVLGIYRIFDYVHQRRCDEVVVILRDEMEFKTLQEIKVILIKNLEIHLDFKPWCFGAASRPKDFLNSALNEYIPSPVSLKISNLTEVSRVTTPYLGKILLGFESTDDRDVTGITFLYDNKRDSIRPFGFVAFSNVKSMLKYHERTIRVWDEFIKCEASLRVPVLLSEYNKSMLKPNPAQFTEDISNANLLNMIALQRAVSNSSLAQAIGLLQIRESFENIVVEPMEEDASDADSILSLECDYDFDENMNLIKK